MALQARKVSGDFDKRATGPIRLARERATGSCIAKQHYTVLCKSNASKMREFRSLFMSTFQESLRKSLSDNLRPFEQNFPGTKNDISLNFRYEAKFHDDKRRFTNSVPEISRWTDTTIPHTIYSIYPSYNVRERYTEGFQRTSKLEFRYVLRK